MNKLQKYEAKMEPKWTPNAAEIAPKAAQERPRGDCDTFGCAPRASEWAKKRALRLSPKMDLQKIRIWCPRRVPGRRVGGRGGHPGEVRRGQAPPGLAEICKEFGRNLFVKDL